MSYLELLPGKLFWITRCKKVGFGKVKVIDWIIFVFTLEFYGMLDLNLGVPKIASNMYNTSLLLLMTWWKTKLDMKQFPVT